MYTECLYNIYRYNINEIIKKINIFHPDFHLLAIVWYYCDHSNEWLNFIADRLDLYLTKI